MSKIKEVLLLQDEAEEAEEVILTKKNKPWWYIEPLDYTECINEGDLDEG